MSQDIYVIYIYMQIIIVMLNCALFRGKWPKLERRERMQIKSLYF